MDRTSDSRQGNSQMRLYHWGLDGAGVLYPLAGRAGLHVDFEPRHVKLLYALWLVREQDADLEPAVRGWRTAEQLGKAYGDLLPNLLPISGDSVRKYLCEIRRRIEDGFRRAGVSDVPLLVESQRGKGYRLAIDDLVLIDRSRLGT